MYIHPQPRHTIAFAGLWARARTDAGEQLSFTIITGPPNDLVKPIHDRMPVVLDASAYAAWLDPSLDADGARALLGVPPIGDWILEPVSPRVNSAQVDDPTLVEPIAVDAPAQRDLFE
jgi:putative SOS response-associated peptidase YedK